MPRSTFMQLMSLVWPLLTSGLDYKCSFEEASLKQQTPHNLTGSISTEPLTFIQQLPSFRSLSHSCVVTTGKSDNLLRVKARAFGETNGKVLCRVHESFQQNT